MQISVEHIKKTYHGGIEALKDVSFEMKSPELIGLIGPNGAGKSTLIQMLVTGMLPTNGVINIDDIPILKKEKELKKHLGYLPQSFGLYDELSVYQFLDYIATLKGIRDAKEEIVRVIKLTNMQEKQNSKIKTLSGGQRQRVGIAQALLGQPELLVFDEPTVGLDPEERINFRNLFSKEADNKILILSTHIIEDIQSICNRLIILHKGIVKYDGTPERLINKAKHHVAIIDEIQNQTISGNYHIISRINTGDGIRLRIVGDVLPLKAQFIEPSLEDAYMYLITREEV